MLENFNFAEIEQVAVVGYSKKAVVKKYSATTIEVK